jgi:hypothetical protein
VYCLSLTHPVLLFQATYDFLWNETMSVRGDRHCYHSLIATWKKKKKSNTYMTLCVSVSQSWSNVLTGGQSAVCRFFLRNISLGTFFVSCLSNYKSASGDVHHYVSVTQVRSWAKRPLVTAALRGKTIKDGRWRMSSPKTAKLCKYVDMPPRP